MYDPTTLSDLFTGRFLLEQRNFYMLQSILVMAKKDGFGLSNQGPVGSQR